MAAGFEICDSPSQAGRFDNQRTSPGAEGSGDCLGQLVGILEQVEQ